MIKSVHIKNFEAHADSFFEFEKGINNISGSSDNGKSSVIKALNWCLFNQPQGFAFKKYGAKADTFVRIEFSDGTYLERTRGTKINQYDCNGEILTALGSGVPDAVKELTKIEPINTQLQFDQFFLLQESSGEVARTLNSIVGLEIIDDALSKSGKIVSNARNSINTKTEQEKEFESSLNQYTWVDKAENCFGFLEETVLKSKTTESLLKKLEQFIVDLNEVSIALDSISIIDTNLIKTILADLYSYKKNKETIFVLESLINNLLENELSVKKFTNLPILKEIYVTLLPKVNEYKEMSEQEINIGKLLADDERCTNAWKDTNEWLSCKELYNNISKETEQYKKSSETLYQIEKEIDRELEIRTATNKILDVIKSCREKEAQIKSEIKICPVCNKPFENGECC